MHAEAFLYVNQFGTDAPITVVEIGSRDVNGTVRRCFPNADWYGIDVEDGDAVDEVADGATWQPEAPVDLVICCEVFEHAVGWRDIVANIATMLLPGGRVILTAAGPERQPHSAVDGGELRPDEFYANIDPADLESTLTSCGFSEVEVDVLGGDVRATAVWVPAPAKKVKAAA